MPERVRSKGERMPVTRMLPDSSPCELRLLIPDTKIGQDGFHDVVVENLIGSSTWPSRHVSPSDVIALRRRWPRAVFQVMRERSVELEDLRRQAYAGLQSAYRYTGRGYCPVCEIRTFFGFTYDVLPSRLGPALALPGRMVRGVERLRPGVPGSLQ